MSRWAVLLIDLQAGILDSPKIPWERPGTGTDVLDVATKVVASARQNGAMVFHVGVRRPYHLGAFDEPRTAAASASGKSPRDVFELVDPADVAFKVDVHPGEEVMYKFGVSAFATSHLDDLLRNAGIRQVMTVGVFTHMAVESTVRAGYDLGYEMTVVSDGCCAPVSALHESSLGSIRNFARVVNSEEALTELGRVS